MLKPEDEFAIRDLYSRYNACVDTGAYDDWAACFIEDGQFIPAVTSGGRAAIAALGKTRLEARASQPWRDPQHWNSNLILSGDGNSAQALCYIMRIVRMKDTGQSVTNVLGTYQDHLVKQNGRWLFKSRRVSQERLAKEAIPQPT